LEQDRALMTTLLDSLLADEKCPKLLYINLLKYVRGADVHLDALSDTFARYFDKFAYRFGFGDLEIAHLNSYFLGFQNRRSAK